MPHAVLTDKEVCALLRISAKTLRAVLKSGPTAGCSIDLRKCAPVRIGGGQTHGQRRWRISLLCEVTGITRDEIASVLA